MQKTMIIGHLGRNAEVNDFNSNQVINFPVAVTEKWTSNGERREKTTWYQCAKWGNNTAVAKYLTKGTQVYVEGNVEAEAYTSKQGESKAVLRLKVFKVELLSRGEEPLQSQPQEQPQPQKQEYQPAGLPQEQEDDLPF